jgi:hypothetical protein
VPAGKNPRGALLRAPLRNGTIALALACTTFGCARLDRAQENVTSAESPTTGSVRAATPLPRRPRERPKVGATRIAATTPAAPLAEIDLTPAIAATADTMEGTAATVVEAPPEPDGPLCACLSLFCPERIESCGRLLPPDTSGPAGLELVYATSVALLQLPQFELKPPRAE